jgi:hypothetical protein
MSGTIIFLAGLGAMAVAAVPREREKKAPAGTAPTPKNSKPNLKLVGGKDVPLDVPFDARLQLPRKPPLEAVASARLFAAWLRKYHVGKHTDRVLLNLYAQYCEISGVEPTPDNMMRSELQEMRGIRRAVESIPASQSKTGKRHRPVAWFVEGPRAEPAPSTKKRKRRKAA